MTDNVPLVTNKADSDIKVKFDSMEIKIKSKDENISKITKSSNENEEKLNRVILNSNREISKLKEELDKAKKSILLLSDEKENLINSIKRLTEENEMLYKSKNNIESMYKELFNKENNASNSQKDDQIKSLKKTISTLIESKKEYKDIILKQEYKIKGLLIEKEKLNLIIKKKDEDLLKNTDYIAKLTSIIADNKKEINKLEQYKLKLEEINDIKKEIKMLKEELGYKQNKIKILSLNNNNMFKNKLSNHSHIKSISTNFSTACPFNLPIDSTMNIMKGKTKKIALNKIKPHSVQLHKPIEKKYSARNFIFSSIGNEQGNNDINFYRNTPSLKQKPYVFKSMRLENSNQKEINQLALNERGTQFINIKSHPVMPKEVKDIKTSDFMDNEIGEVKELPQFGNISHIENNMSKFGNDNFEDVKEVILKHSNKKEGNLSIEMEFPLIEPYGGLKREKISKEKGIGNKDQLHELKEVKELNDCVDKILNHL